jgi:hypothetical protein
VVDVDSNNEDVIVRLLKIRDNIPIQRGENSVIYALLSQMNNLMYGNRTLTQSLDPYFVVRDEQLHLYLQQFRDVDVQNRNTYTLEDGLYIGRKELGRIATKFNKVIICFITGKFTNNKVLAKVLTRHAGIYFHNDETHVYNAHLPLLRVCIAYYNKFVNQDSPITEDSTIEFILSALLKNKAVIGLVICKSEVTSLLFKTNRNPSYVDDKLDQEMKMNFTPKTFKTNKIFKNKLMILTY